MDSSINVTLLFERYANQLSLQWIAGQEGSNRSLDYTDTANTPGQTLVGYINIIHPNQVQIFGSRELEYLFSQEKKAQEDFIARLFDNTPAAIIIAESHQAPDILRTMADKYKTPLLSSQLPASKLISQLQHYIDIELSVKTVIHGVMLEVHGLGVLLTGESGIGKSELALELITRNHRLIADDAPVFFRVGPDIVRGSCPDALRDFMEVRGLGILNIRSMYGDSAIKFSKDLRLIINLELMEQDVIEGMDRLKGCYGSKTILDIEIPMVTLPVASGRNLAVLVEAAVKNSILHRKGYNSSDAFINRQQQLINQQQQ